MSLTLSVVLTRAARSQVGPVGPRPLLASASSTEKFTKLAINGNGSINYVSTNCASKGLVCAPGDTCQCIEITGNCKGNVVGAGTFDFIVDSDITTGFPQGAGQNEFFGAGLITLTSGSNTLTFETSGLVGNSALGASAQYGGSYGASSGTGKFATSVGSGNAQWWNGNFSTSTDTQISLVGNIDLKP